MVDYVLKDHYTLADLQEIVRILRHPGGCPWDIEQTHSSLRRNLLEESYETVEAIEEGSIPHLKEELGDVLLQVLFHTSIEEDAGSFNLDDVADGVCKKLIYRHPHVFGEVAVHSTGEVLSNWEKLKQQEKGQATTADILDAVPKNLPALWRAEKMQKKAQDRGYSVRDYCSEAMALSQSVATPEDAKKAIGNLLFEAVRQARRYGVDPEDALNEASNRFEESIRSNKIHTGA